MWKFVGWYTALTFVFAAFRPVVGEAVGIVIAFAFMWHFFGEPRLEFKARSLTKAEQDRLEQARQAERIRQDTNYERHMAERRAQLSDIEFDK